MSQAIIGKRITKRYHGTEILHDVSFHVNQGEIYGLLGKNGIGKTTLLKIITRMIPPCGYRGQLDVNAPDEIGSFLESPSCFTDLSVRENLNLYAMLSEKSPSRRKEKIDEVSSSFDLTGFLHKRARELSLGMLQKLRAAMTFLSPGNILVLDEPFNGLDIDGVFRLRDQIRTASKKHGKTVLVTSHNTAELERLCDRFGILHHGTLLEVKREALGGSNLESFYLEILKGERTCYSGEI